MFCKKIINAMIIVWIIDVRTNYFKFIIIAYNICGNNKVCASLSIKII